jgi:hypothetical protein
LGTEDYDLHDLNLFLLSLKRIVEDLLADEGYAGHQHLSFELLDRDGYRGISWAPCDGGLGCFVAAATARPRLGAMAGSAAPSPPPLLGRGPAAGLRATAGSTAPLPPWLLGRGSGPRGGPGDGGGGGGG